MSRCASIYAYEKITKGEINKTSFLMAEHVKLIQNTYCDYCLAFANALSMYCDSKSLDTHELIKLVNQHPRIDVLELESEDIEYLYWQRIKGSESPLLSSLVICFVSSRL